LKYVFITGLGRSGSTFLAQLLAHDQDADVHHEYINSREFFLMSWYLPAEIYASRVLRHAKEEIERTRSRPRFVDVNSYLQNSVEALRDVFDDPQIYHLVRDPRLVIPSLYMRRDNGQMRMLPKDPEAMDIFLRGSKFEQICWHWAQTTRQLLDSGTRLLQFDKVLGSYEYLHETLLEPAGLNVSNDAWQAVRTKRVNNTKPRIIRRVYAAVSGRTFVHEVLAPFADWTPDQHAVFTRHCGDLCERLGYSNKQDSSMVST
jgi:hypothetical protein